MADSGTPKFECAILSDIGMKRKQNQDSGVIRPDLGLFMVADGMGGHKGGETASRVCVEKVLEEIQAGNSPEQALRQANHAIYSLSESNPDLRGMGTTATILFISGSLATILQVGDSRAYFWNSDGIWQLTRDHSLVQEKLRAGLITREQVKIDQMKNVVTRSVGYESGMNIDRYHFPIQKGDGFLICSDGLSGPVDDSLMFEILEETHRSGLSLEAASRKLVETANAHGGDDNVTVALVKVI